MTEVSETQVTVRTTTESIVAVPDSCIENCKELRNHLGRAAIGTLEGYIEAIICDDTNRRRHNFPKKCPAIQAEVRLGVEAPLNPMIIGLENETRAWVDRVDQAIEEHGVRGILETNELIKYPYRLGEA